MEWYWTRMFQYEQDKTNRRAKRTEREKNRQTRGKDSQLSIDGEMTRRTAADHREDTRSYRCSRVIHGWRETRLHKIIRDPCFTEEIDLIQLNDDDTCGHRARDSSSHQMVLSPIDCNGASIIGIWWFQLISTWHFRHQHRSTLVQLWAKILLCSVRGSLRSISREKSSSWDLTVEWTIIIITRQSVKDGETVLFLFWFGWIISRPTIQRSNHDRITEWQTKWTRSICNGDVTKSVQSHFQDLHSYSMFAFLPSCSFHMLIGVFCWSTTHLLFDANGMTHQYRLFWTLKKRSLSLSLSLCQWIVNEDSLMEMTLKANVLRHLPRLEDFMFNIRSMIPVNFDRIHWPTNEEIRCTLTDLTKYPVISQTWGSLSHLSKSIFTDRWCILKCSTCFTIWWMILRPFIYPALGTIISINENVVRDQWIRTTGETRSTAGRCEGTCSSDSISLSASTSSSACEDWFWWNRSVKVDIKPVWLHGKDFSFFSLINQWISLFRRFVPSEKIFDTRSIFNLHGDRKLFFPLSISEQKTTSCHQYWSSLALGMTRKEKRMTRSRHRRSGERWFESTSFTRTEG